MVKLFSGLFDSNEKEIKRTQPRVDEINGLEDEYKQLSDEQLRAKTEEFKKIIADATSSIQPRLTEAQQELCDAKECLAKATWDEERGEMDNRCKRAQERIDAIDKDFHKEEAAALNEILPQAFAAVREAGKRAIGQRAFDVQLMGAITLHQGKIAEMRTGEGKTLVATFPLYLNALTGRGVHLVTVNDYLARYHAYWMGAIYNKLGITVACIYPMQTPDEHTPARLYDPTFDTGKENDRWNHYKPISRQEAYKADITYGTSSEFGFDYLRDNMVVDLKLCVQRPLYYAIVDEVDNLLIDEARTPLIISGPAEDAGQIYKVVNDVVGRMKIKVLPYEPGQQKREEEEAGLDEEFDAVAYEKEHYVRATARGQEKLARAFRMTSEDLFGGESGEQPKNYSFEQAKMHNDIQRVFRQAMTAHALYQRDRQYVVESQEIVIVDEFTGRKMYGRRYSEGLHQAIEAKEHVKVQQESLTYATITIQNYFRMYEKLGGMTGTALTEAEEFFKIYKLEVTSIPTNVEHLAMQGYFETIISKENGTEIVTYENKQKGKKRWKRVDTPDLIYKTEEGKFRAVAKEIKQLHEKDIPVLVGTVSIQNSEKISDALKRQGITAQVLNAKQHEKEADIIAKAGEPGRVTVATNMAGRGVDIILGGTPPDYNPELDLQEWLSRKRAEFIEKAENYLKDEPGYAERKKEYLNNSKKDDEEVRKSIDRIKQIYISGEIIENPQKSAEEIPILEENIRQYSNKVLNKFLAWEAKVEDDLKKKSIELETSGKTNILEKIKELLGFKREQSLLIKDINEKISKHKLLKEWSDRHDKVKKLGGLIVIGTERHEARRIDNQLRGRAGRQGDPGHTTFYVSLEDDIMRRFGGDRIKTIMGWVGMDEDTPIENKMITNAITDVQKRVEGYHFDMRKHLVEYDDVVNKHRELIYEERRKILSGADLKSNILDMVTKELKGIVASHASGGYDGMDIKAITTEALSIMPLPPQFDKDGLSGLNQKESEAKLAEIAQKLYEDKEKETGAETMRLLERLVMLQIMDRLWVEHLTTMESERLQAGWATLRQMKSTDAYKSTGFQHFQTLLDTIRHDVAHTIFHVRIEKHENKMPQSPMAKAGVGSTGNKNPKAAAAAAVGGNKVGRNDPCPCGSGKKYKHCHGT